MIDSLIVQCDARFARDDLLAMTLPERVTCQLWSGAGSVLSTWLEEPFVVPFVAIVKYDCVQKCN
jgi:hypothetical protein